MRVGELGGGDLDELGDVVGCPAETADDEQHGRAEVGGDPGVERQLGRTGDVGVVGADDDDDIRLPLDRPVPLDDRGQRGIGVGVHLLVCHADARLVRGVDAAVVKEQLDHLVVAGGRAW